MSTFSLGQIVATPGALDILAAHGLSPVTLIKRHAAGDWGDISGLDRGRNEQSLSDGSRLLSVYKLDEHDKVWIITEAADDNGDRAATTLLLPEDY